MIHTLITELTPYAASCATPPFTETRGEQQTKALAKSLIDIAAPESFRMSNPNS